MWLVSKCLELYNNIKDYIVPLFLWYYQKWVIHPYIEGLFVDEIYISTKKEFCVPKFLVSQCFLDYSRKNKSAEEQFETSRFVHVYATTRKGQIYDVSTVMNFYLDPSGNFWDKMFCEIPKFVFESLLDLDIEKVEYLDNNNALKCLEFN